jgi:hypothetical protein
MQVIKVVVLSLFITDLLELTDIIKAIIIQNILSKEAVETLYTYRFYIGLPSCVYPISINFLLQHPINVLEINSRPLSHLMYSGVPISSFRLLGVSITALVG